MSDAVTTATNGPASAEPGSLTRPQKLAALLVMLGPETAAEILKGMAPAELEAITTEMSRLDLVSQELQREVMREFSGVALAAVGSFQGGPQFARQALEKGLGVSKAAGYLRKLGPVELPPATAQAFADLDTDQLSHLLRHEQPQTIALVLSYLPSDRGAHLLTRLPGDQRDLVVERLATLGPTSNEVVEKVLRWLQSRAAAARPASSPGDPDGMNKAAALLNAFNRTAGRTLLEAIDNRNHELCQAIRKRMFTFHDLVQLDTTTLQRILREVDLRELAVSLKNASEELRGALLACVSRRAAEGVREEMSLMGPTKSKDIEAAQVKVIETVRRLEAEGEIELGASEEAEHANA